MNARSILPPTYFAAAGVISVFVHIAVPLYTLIRFPLTLIGVIPITVGAILNLWADQVFKRQGTTVKPYQQPTAFVNEGPFRWSRHPMYLGMVLILLGISVICGSASSFIGPIAFWLIVRLRFIRR